MMSLTPQEQTILNDALAVIAVAGPALGPNGALAATLITAGANAITAASNAGTDVTDEQLTALFDQFDINEADDQAAQAAANAGTTGTAGT